MNASFSRRAALAALTSSLFQLAGCGGSQQGDPAAPAPAPEVPAPVAPAPPPAPVTTRTFAYVANSAAATVSIFEVMETGALRFVDEEDAGAEVLSVAVHPSGRFAYAVNSGDGLVHAYTIDPGSGMLSPNGDFATGAQPQQMRIHPSGRLAYVGNFADGTVMAYTVADDGKVTGPDFTVDVGAFPSGLAFDATGGFLYVEAGGNVACYGVNTDSNPGELTLVNSVATSALSIDVAIAPSFNAAYVVSTSGEVMVHPIGAAGALEAGTSVLAGAGSLAIAIDPLGQFAYVANYDDQTVSVYTIDPVDGALSPSTAGAVTTGVQPGAIAFSATGLFAYVTSRQENAVYAFTVNRSNGRLEPFGTPVPAGANPRGITVARIPQ